MGRDSLRIFQAIYENIYKKMQARLMKDDLVCFMDKNDRNRKRNENNTEVSSEDDFIEDLPESMLKLKKAVTRVRTVGNIR